ncbi:hypothetical protein ABPG77_003415 [Micractinium sp. CCAP 211/92]
MHRLQNQAQQHQIRAFSVGASLQPPQQPASAASASCGATHAGHYTLQAMRPTFSPKYAPRMMVATYTELRRMKVCSRQGMHVAMRSAWTKWREAARSDRTGQQLPKLMYTPSVRG